MNPTQPDSTSVPSDDYQVQNYQDDLDTSNDMHDPIMDEETDDPTEELGVDPEEYKAELDKYVFGENGSEGDDDRREQLEDLDEDSHS